MPQQVPQLNHIAIAAINHEWLITILDVIINIIIMNDQPSRFNQNYFFIHHFEISSCFEIEVVNSF